MILFVDTVGMSCWRTSIIQQSAAIPSISAAFARTTMTYHSPPAMVAIGLLGDEANRTQLRTVRCDGIPWQRRRSRALVQAKQGYAGGFPFRHSRAGKSV